MYDLGFYSKFYAKSAYYYLLDTVLAETELKYLQKNLLYLLETKGIVLRGSIDPYFPTKEEVADVLDLAASLLVKSSKDILADDVVERQEVTDLGNEFIQLLTQYFAGQEVRIEVVKIYKK